MVGHSALHTHTRPRTRTAGKRSKEHTHTNARARAQTNTRCPGALQVQNGLHHNQAHSHGHNMRAVREVYLRCGRGRADYCRYWPDTAPSTAAYSSPVRSTKPTDFAMGEPPCGQCPRHHRRKIRVGRQDVACHTTALEIPISCKSHKLQEKQ